MMACTSPAFTVREIPLRISFPEAVAWRSEIVSIWCSVAVSDSRRQVAGGRSAGDAKRSESNCYCNDELRAGERRCARKGGAGEAWTRDAPTGPDRSAEPTQELTPLSPRVRCPAVA